MASWRRSGGHTDVSGERRTGEYETALGIRVINLDRLAVHCVYARWTVSPHHFPEYFGTYTSPGLVAFGPGKFSVRGVATIRLIGSWSWAIAKAEATTVAAPPVRGVNGNELNPGGSSTHPCLHASTSYSGRNELVERHG